LFCDLEILESVEIEEERCDVFFIKGRGELLAYDWRVNDSFCDLRDASDDKEEVFWDEFLGVLTWTALGWEKVVIVRWDWWESLNVGL
jgi:hypothetical protein